MGHIVGMDQGKIIDLKPGEYRRTGVAPVEDIHSPSIVRRILGLALASALFGAGCALLVPMLEQGILPLNLPGVAGINLLVIGLIWFIVDLRPPT